MHQCLGKTQDGTRCTRMIPKGEKYCWQHVPKKAVPKKTPPKQSPPKKTPPKKDLPKKNSPKKTSLKEKVYLIHDNRNKPFKVHILDNYVTVYKMIDFEKETYGNKPLFLWKADKIFIGTSPQNQMTTESGYYGPKYDGNTVLLKISTHYIYIGFQIYQFDALEEIVKFVAPIGNNDVPYPYAVDKKGNYYLLTENVIMQAHAALNKEAIYEYYYEHFHDVWFPKYIIPLKIKVLHKRI